MNPLYAELWKRTRWGLQTPRFISRCTVKNEYAESVVDCFANRKQSEYYGENISVYIEVLSLEQFKQV